MGNYLAVFLSNKAGPKWQAWYALSDAERKARDDEGIPALAAWDDANRDSIVHVGGPLGKTKQMTLEGTSDVVNEMTAFVVVRAESHEAAVKLFEAHPHLTIFPCHAVEVMPVFGGE